MANESPKKKRKREETLEPMITYHTPMKTFERLFHETSLEDTKRVVRRKLGLAHDAKVQLAQIRGGNAIVLEDDDDFQAFCVTLKANPLVDVQVTLSDAITAGSKSNQGEDAPALKKRKVKRKESKRQEEDSADNSSEQPALSTATAPPDTDVSVSMSSPKSNPELQALHAKAWGKSWPHSKGTISKTDILDEEPGSVNDKIYGLADKLEVPPYFHYRCFKETQVLKSALGASSGQEDTEDVLVVRNEYEMLRQALEDDLKSKHSIVVTGHPGIGKSTFLLYLLLHRLENRLPTAVQFDAEHYFIFDEQGVVVNKLPTHDQRLKKCWALTDSNEDVRHPCRAFQIAKRVILASSPKPDRWKDWITQAGRWGYCIISDLPSVPEIAAIAKELKYNPSSTLSLVRKWGPSTRNILRSMECAISRLNDPIQEAAEQAATRICTNASATLKVSEGIRMAESEGSSVIFLRRTRGGSVKSDTGKTFIPTSHLLTIFEEQRKNKSNEESLKLFYAFLNEDHYGLAP